MHRSGVIQRDAGRGDRMNRRMFNLMAMSLMTESALAQTVAISSVGRQPAKTGFDARASERLQHHLERASQRTRSVVIWQNGKTAYWYTRQGTRPDERHHLASVTKSVISLLVGIAIRNGHLKGLDALIAEIFSEAPKPDSDRKLSGLTLRHLLTMASGFVEVGDDRAWRATEKGLVFTAGPTTTPGTVFSYDSRSSDLVSAALTKVTGQSAEAYAVEHLFKPLGIERYEWSTSPLNLTRGGYGLHLSISDMVRLGQLVLSKGQWNGNRIVPAAYIDEATYAQIQVGGPGSTPYGLHWWAQQYDGNNMPLASGAGGQAIIVAPKFNAVVAITSDAGGPANNDFVNQIILPSLSQ
jgi:CubicO group peptidase (beta-lactamase class C family)